MKSGWCRTGLTGCSREVGRRVVVLSLLRWLPCVNEVALVQIGLLLRSGRSPEDRVAVREPVEAGDNLKMAAGLADRMLIDRSRALGSFESDLPRHCNDTLQPFSVALVHKTRSVASAKPGPGVWGQFPPSSG